MRAHRLILACLVLAASAALAGPFPHGGKAGSVGNYPAGSIAYVGCSNTKGEVISYAAVSQRAVLWPGYTTESGIIPAWEKDDGTQVPGTGALSTPANSIPEIDYVYWTRFDARRRFNNPVGGQQLLGVWVNLCDNANDTAHGVAAPTNATINTVFALLKKHTTDCIATPSNCGESVAPNIANAATFKVWVSMINTYRTQSVCYDMNTGGVGLASNDLTNGTISAGATSVTMTSVSEMTTSGNGSKFSWLLDDGTQVLQTVTSITGLVVGFIPAIPASRSVASGTRAYVGNGNAQATTRAFMQHAVGASYAGFASVGYGPNGTSQTDAFYPTIAAADGAFYPFGPLDATITPSDTISDRCHPSTTGSLSMGGKLATFIDALIQ